MATAGEHFKMPDGSLYIVRRPAAETDGEAVEMEFVLPSGCGPPPPHIHPQQVEEYEVLDGRFVVRVRNWHRPAMRFEDFIERTSHTLQAAGVKRKRDPRVYPFPTPAP
jgi:hypothetical protein